MTPFRLNIKLKLLFHGFVLICEAAWKNVSRMKNSCFSHVARSKPVD